MLPVKVCILSTHALCSVVRKWASLFPTAAPVSARLHKRLVAWYQHLKARSSSSGQRFKKISKWCKARPKCQRSLLVLNFSLPSSHSPAQAKTRKWSVQRLWCGFMEKVWDNLCRLIWALLTWGVPPPFFHTNRSNLLLSPEGSKSWHLLT